MSNFSFDLEDEEELMQGDPEPADSIAGPQTPREMVMQRISQVRSSSGDDENQDGRDSALEFAKNSAMTAGMGRGLNALASATGYKADNSQYDAMDKRGMDLVSKEMDRATQVRKAIESRKVRQAMINAQNQRSQVADRFRNTQLAETARHNRAMEANAATNAEARGDPDLKVVPAETAIKLGNLLGAADASRKIEELGSGMNTGKMAATGDWFKELVGMQDTDRAKALADIGTQRNEVMSRIAGANVVADEKKRVEEGIPTRTDAPESFLGKGQSTTDGLIHKVENEIAALEGSYDTTQLKQQLADLKARRDATRQAHASKGGGGGGLVTKANAGAGRVNVSNGKETLSIELNDLPDAMADGFQVIK